MKYLHQIQASQACKVLSQNPLTPRAKKSPHVVLKPMLKHLLKQWTSSPIAASIPRNITAPQDGTRENPSAL
jgi:hypothetical protein